MNQWSFGKTSHGKEVCKYEISNKNGMKAVLTDLGTSVVELINLLLNKLL